MSEIAVRQNARGPRRFPRRHGLREVRCGYLTVVHPGNPAKAAATPAKDLPRCLSVQARGTDQGVDGTRCRAAGPPRVACRACQARDPAGPPSSVGAPADYALGIGPLAVVGLAVLCGHASFWLTLGHRNLRHLLRCGQAAAAAVVADFSCGVARRAPQGSYGSIYLSLMGSDDQQSAYGIAEKWEVMAGMFAGSWPAFSGRSQQAVRSATSWCC